MPVFVSPSPAINPPAGSAINVAANLSTAGTSVTITADQFVVATSLGGSTYLLSSFSETFNGTTTGAGGMDTGSLPSSGFVAIYAIYNPTSSAAALLGTNGNTACPTIYGGSHMPSGYTASALIAVWPTNSSAQLIAACLTGRKLTFSPVIVLNVSSNNTSFTAQSISSIVPPNATRIGGVMVNTMGTSPTAGNYYIAISGNAGTLGYRLMDFSFPATSGAVAAAMFEDLPIPTPQTLYYENTASGTSPSSLIELTSYSW